MYSLLLGVQLDSSLFYLPTDLEDHLLGRGSLQDDRQDCLLQLVHHLLNDEHGKDLRLEDSHVLQVEGDVEEGQEGVDKLKEHQLGHHILFKLFLGPMVLPLTQKVSQT